MRRLYWQIYLTALAILLIFWVLIASFWFFFHPRSLDAQLFDGIASVASELIGSAEQPPRNQQRALERLADWFDVEIALFDSDGELLAKVGESLPVPDPERQKSGWVIDFGRGPTASLRLADNRWLVVRHERRPGRALHALLMLALASAIGAYPVVRWLTRRLERLQEQVDRLGRGELSTRVRVEGRDEVAALAESFNRTAAHIEELVRAQKQILADASHELRSPLARMRVAVELLKGEDEADLKHGLARDIAELDELIDELLLASRLEAGQELEHAEPMDLLALAAEESLAYGAQVAGVSVEVVGDPRLLRRLIRNLLENARRHGGADSIAVEVDREGSVAVLRVRDHGPGIPEAEKDRIFEPFYRLRGHGESGDGGVGLGLSLVRRIARRYGGEVVYRAGPQGGSIFEVSLPF